ncbi:hypothetical protein PPL_12383 [Heterostelium album PN500]|uniref:COI1 F-box domain-containing protein n=1 Tax=Heterostelium pallidum (strain ATCC 26659 / Pp 5 / PN500) TaxID=670386 RepID=D3BMG3_HETP5|nr:hypothetical protein PPL_12383 [Heterostelium album PN500]EFA77175.1 hypothetical protein PPL_12383 [Heterostelium album PN500]|eukprot:XP_020429304.1 hypothetical protein PPL_12383 [Heterostelium album PN500]
MSIVSFSDLLLKYIVSYIDDNVDRIVFSLVCKRWFEKRNNFLHFKYDDFIKHIYVDQNKKTNLSSFNQLLKQTNSIQSNILEIKDNLKLLKIPENITEIIIDRTITKIEDWKYMIKQSNVRSIIFDSTFVQKIEPGTLPSNVKSIRFCSSLFVSPLELGCLPDGLESLELPTTYDKPIQPGVLPNSLKQLNLGYTRLIPTNSLPVKVRLQVGSLPPNLEELRLNVITPYQIENVNVLPKSLKSIDNCPINWIKYYLKELPLIESVVISDNVPSGFLTPGDLPPTITKLIFRGNPYNKLSVGVIPSSVRHLDLGGFEISLGSNVLPKDAHYDYLNLGLYYNIPILPNQLPPNIKELSMCSYNQRLSVGSLPHGIVKLDITMCDISNIEVDSIPSSVEILTIGSNCVSNNNNNNNNNKNNSNNKMFHPITENVRTLISNVEALSKCDIKYLPKTVLSITVASPYQYQYELKRVGPDHFLFLYKIVRKNWWQVGIPFCFWFPIASLGLKIYPSSFVLVLIWFLVLVRPNSVDKARINKAIGDAEDKYGISFKYIQKYMKKTIVIILKSYDSIIRNTYFSKHTLYVIEQVDLYQYKDVAYYYFDDVQSKGIPKHINEIRFSNSMNKDISVLKSTIESSNICSIVFGQSYNQPFRAGVSLPNGIKSISLGRDYNSTLEVGCFPEGLERLELGEYFNQPLDPGVLPISLKYLKLGDEGYRYRCGSNFNMQLEPGSLPPNLEELHFDCQMYSYPLKDGTLPKSLKTIVYCQLEWLKYLKTLPLIDNLSFSDDIPLLTLKPGDIPSTVTKLYFHPRPVMRVNNKLGPVIPPSVKHLDMGGSSYSMVEDPSVNTPIFSRETHYDYFNPGARMDQTFFSHFPPNIIELDLRQYRWSVEPPGVLPATIKKLSLSKPINPDAIPKSVEHVVLKDMTIGVFPNDIKTVDVVTGYQHILDKGINIIPKSVKNIKIVGSLRYSILLRRIDNSSYIIVLKDSDHHSRIGMITSLGLMKILKGIHDNNSQTSQV